MKKNEVYVTNDLQDEKLWSNQIKFTSAHWINEPLPNQKLSVRIRHQANLIPVKALNKSSNFWKADLEDEVRALTPGQSAVFYAGNQVLGGGIVV